MKENKKLHSIILALASLILLLILISSAASAAQPTITETRITTHGTARVPDIYGDRIVWADTRNGGSDIYMYDLSNKKETQITTSGKASWPAIYGDRIVWADTRNGGSDIYMQNLSTKEEIRITMRGEAQMPGIYGNNIVWDERSDYMFSSPDVYAYNISTKKETKIGSMFLFNDINGNKIVLDNCDDEIWGYILLYNLSTNELTTIYSDGNASDTHIYGDRIVWSDWRRNYEPDIYMYDLSTKNETRITTSGKAIEPAIYGNRIVWKDKRNYTDWERGDIYMYDLSTKQETRITTSGYAYNVNLALSPAIYGDRVVWSDWRNYKNDSKNDIYLATISYSPIAAFSATPTIGKKPLIVKFTDKSTGSPTSWSWDFGDKTTSKAQNPTHKYTKAGKYSVSLTVKNSAGSNTKKLTNYITVK